VKNIEHVRARSTPPKSELPLYRTREELGFEANAFFANPDDSIDPPTQYKVRTGTIEYANVKGLWDLLSYIRKRMRSQGKSCFPMINPIAALQKSSVLHTEETIVGEISKTLAERLDQSGKIVFEDVKFLLGFISGLLTARSSALIDYTTFLTDYNAYCEVNLKAVDDLTEEDVLERITHMTDDLARMLPQKDVKPRKPKRQTR